MLQTEPDDKPTEYGAIEVNLNGLPEEVELVLRPNSLWGDSQRLPYTLFELPGLFSK